MRWRGKDKSSKDKEFEGETREKELFILWPRQPYKESEVRWLEKATIKQRNIDDPIDGKDWIEESWVDE
jgi:hypothetical protein